MPKIVADVAAASKKTAKALAEAKENKEVKEEE
jgi:hypothetical protein